MYNLAHLYMYEINDQKNIDKSIELLIKSSNFNPSKNLLCIALIKKYGFNIEYIKKELLKQTDKNIELTLIIYNMIQDMKLIDKIVFDITYNFYKKVDFIYNFIKIPIPSFFLNYQNQSLKKKQINITPDFYNGFGIDI